MDNQSRKAEVVAWESPGGVAMVLTRGSENGGTLDVCITHETVNISGRKCQYRIHDIDGQLTGAKGIVEKLLSEIDITLPLSRCQITWKHVEDTDT